MKVLLDTSILVAAMVSAHPHHASALPCLQSVRQGENEGIIAAHSLAECYAVMTALPVKPRLSPSQVRRMLKDNLEDRLAIQTLSAANYRSVLDRLTEAGFSGGIAYDALILEAAREASVERVFTLNRRDFLRIAPDWEERIVQP